MKLKRLMFIILISVLIVIAMPLTAFAELNHPLSADAFKNVKWYSIEGNAFPETSSTVRNADVVLIRYFPSQGNYVIYVCKKDDLTKSATSGNYTSTKNLVNFDVTVESGFEYFPNYIRYKMNPNKIVIASSKVTEYLYDKEEIAMVFTAEPESPDEPDDPIIDPPEPPVDPPEPPSSPINGVISSSLEILSTKIVTDVGTIVNVGIVIMGIILAVWMVIRIIKKFVG